MSSSWCVRLVGTWLDSDRELGAQEGGTKPGHELFHGVGLNTEPV